jgi:hypothetical protein
MTLPTNSITTFGDARRTILDTIQRLASGEMDVGRGMAIAANMKVLNDNVQVEINAAKTVILATEKGHDFGRVVGMGQRLIGNIEGQQA